MKDFSGPGLLCKCPFWFPSTLLGWTSPAQPCFYSRLLHGPTGAAVPAQHSAKQTALPATEIAQLHLTSHIPGKLCRLQQRKRKSTLYVVGKCKEKLGEREGGESAGPPTWKRSGNQVLFCHGRQKASRAFSFRLFCWLFFLYNLLFLTTQFESKLENKSIVTATSLKGKTKSNRHKLLLNSVCAHVYMHHLLKASRTVSM